MNPQPPNNNPGGFSLVELLMAAAIGAAVIAAAVMGFGTLTGLSLGRSTVNVKLPAGVMADLYGTNAEFVTLGNNPNYFQSAQARRMQDRLMDDVAASVAVFCLGRNASGAPALRPFSLAVPASTDFRSEVTTPSKFRDFLVGAVPSLESVFPAAQNGALLGCANASIILVKGLANNHQAGNTLVNLAFYEVDFIPTVDPAGGIVASVRRYGGTNNSVPTDYYHVYYPGEGNGANGFRPLAAFFGRKDAAAAAGVSDPFGVAVNQPFTFVWWPDPLVSKLEGADVPGGSAEAARDNYSNMAGRTSLFFVLPAFPPL